MDKIAVAVLPVADVHIWQEFLDEASRGDRAEAHQAFLRRGGVTTEHVFHQQTPMGDLMVLVWEGVDPDELGQHFASMLQDPQSDHERYLHDHVIPKIHGVDLSAPPPPTAQEVSTTVV